MIMSLPSFKRDCKPRKLVPKFLQEKIRQIRTKKKISEFDASSSNFFLLRFSNQLKLKPLTKTFPVEFKFKLIIFS